MECDNKNILHKDFFFHIDYKLDANTIRVYYITYNYSKDTNNRPIQSHIYLDYYNIYIYIRNLNFLYNIYHFVFLLE